MKIEQIKKQIDVMTENKQKDESNTPKYRDWDILEDLPEGWVIDKTAGSPAPRTVFITNGKSVLNGQKRALLRVSAKQDVFIQKNEIKQVVAKDETTEEIPFPAKTVNTLARKKFQEQLLNEIHFDLAVCEIEGWDKTEYIKELQKLLNSIDVKKKKKGNDYKQQSLFEDNK